MTSGVSRLDAPNIVVFRGYMRPNLTSCSSILPHKTGIKIFSQGLLDSCTGGADVGEGDPEFQEIMQQCDHMAHVLSTRTLGARAHTHTRNTHTRDMYSEAHTHTIGHIPTHTHSSIDPYRHQDFLSRASGFMDWGCRCWGGGPGVSGDHAAV